MFFKAFTDSKPVGQERFNGTGGQEAKYKRVAKMLRKYAEFSTDLGVQSLPWRRDLGKYLRLSI